jgi:hypothetical protein
LVEEWWTKKFESVGREERERNQSSPKEFVGVAVCPEKLGGSGGLGLGRESSGHLHMFMGI